MASLLFIIGVHHSLYSQIRLILTAALSDAHFSWRKKQYLESFNTLYRYGYRKNDFYIVEALKKHGPTFLNNHCNNVYYAKNNNPHVKNNGINEVITLLEALEHFNFDDEDIIIKLTGRHLLLNTNFLNLVRSHQNSADIIVRWATPFVSVYTTLIAMKYKYFKEMILSYAIDDQWIDIEHAAGAYINQKMKTSDLKIIFVNNLGIEANTFGSTTCLCSRGIVYQ